MRSCIPSLVKSDFTSWRKDQYLFQTFNLKVLCKVLRNTAYINTSVTYQIISMQLETAAQRTPQCTAHIHLLDVFQSIDQNRLSYTVCGIHFVYVDMDKQLFTGLSMWGHWKDFSLV